MEHLTEEQLNSLQITNEQQYNVFTQVVNETRALNGLSEIAFEPYNIVSDEMKAYIKQKYGKDLNINDTTDLNNDIQNYLKFKKWQK